MVSFTIAALIVFACLLFVYIRLLKTNINVDPSFMERGFTPSELQQLPTVEVPEAPLV